MEEEKTTLKTKFVTFIRGVNTWYFAFGIIFLLFFFIYKVSSPRGLVESNRTSQQLAEVPQFAPTKTPTPKLITTLTPEPTPIPTTKPAATPKPTKTPTPTKVPTPTNTPTPIPTPTPEAKAVKLSVFKNLFIEHYDYGSFSKKGTSSDNWDIWESTNYYGDLLILFSIGEDIQSGILKAGPNDTASLQVVSFFMLGHPPLVEWVEEITPKLVPGQKEETILDGVEASIMISVDRIWIANFTKN